MDIIFPNQQLYLIIHQLSDIRNFSHQLTKNSHLKKISRNPVFRKTILLKSNVVKYAL